MNIDQDRRDSRSELRKPSGVSTRPPNRWRRRIGWLALFLAALGGLAWIVLRPHVGPQTSRRFSGNGPMPVVAAPVQKGDVPISLAALGTVSPLATVTVKTQIAGQLIEIGFQEGQAVHAGDFLAQIDPRPYQRQLDQYQGQLLRDQALLKEAQINLDRYQRLVAQDSIAKQQLDAQESLTQQYRGTVETDKAQIDTAKLNLTYCHIIAPLTGRVGLRQVDQGNYVQTSDANGIVVITQLQPITVVFTLPEDNLPAVMKRLHAGATLPVTVFDRAQTIQLATGKLTTVDNQIDTTTGTVKLRAQFGNEDGMLFPNQFVNTRLLVDTLHDATVMPIAAVQRGAPGTFVYLVKADHTVTVRPVKLGPVAGDQVAIESGVEAGDQVVIDGADKLREGAEIALPEAAKGDASPARPPGTGDAARPRGEHKKGAGGDRPNRSEP